MQKLKRIVRQPDVLAVLVLVLLWVVFFWRLLTPVTADQVSLRDGDFSGQFYTFASYQYKRFVEGEIPLWNPFNNGGLPFIADPQAAVFYPPRLITIFLSQAFGGWTYNALQIEMMVHVLVYTLFMYLFVRRLVWEAGNKGVFSALVAALIAGYGGFMTGYPPLQLALLEAGIWLPLILLGVFEGCRGRYPRLRFFILSGLGLGLSWMAGHAQTSWFATYMTVVYGGFHFYVKRWRWPRFVLSIGAMVLVAVGIAAAQLLPGIEYLTLTMRAGFGFDEKAGGFPIHDMVQFLYPGIVSLYSPLYIGIAGLLLAVFGTIGRHRERFFWAITALLALALSLGENGALFHGLYNVLPGLRFFRGQERAAYLVANNLAILAGLGVIHLEHIPRRVVQRIAGGLVIFLVLAALIIFMLWVGDRDAYGSAISGVIFSSLVGGAFWLIITSNTPVALRVYFLLTILVIFELFSVNIDNSNYVSIPVEAQPILQPRSLLEPILTDEVLPFRVDGGMVNGKIGIYGEGNTGSLHNIEDIRGISPLFLDGAHAIIQRESPPQVAWEVFSVRYVFDGGEVLPVPSDVVGVDVVNGVSYYLHKLNNARPFAHLVFDYEVLDSDGFARALLADPDFNIRDTLILNREPGIDLTTVDAATYDINVLEYLPEYISAQVNTDESGLLSLALVDYPGWVAYIDGLRVEKLRAFGGVTALEIPAGEHLVEMRYESQTYQVGVFLALLTIGMLFILFVRRVVFVNNRKSLEFNFVPFL